MELDQDRDDETRGTRLGSWFWDLRGYIRIVMVRLVEPD